ncbi:hypothetical protein PC129_g12189 [Phytophthora cactorum]|uniref:Uncharacterized protein n=1 Tax=Phytophthora cactorum TaxID=29920 RepID=A0A329RJ35_9STRA|nr:hypothetical protein Pcac1_g18108 [Phytophthora cactorum]KAG2824968.1 hypothetical protein PC111_g9587 [Phytophthora cactorum]KAG2854251.1 hypothetical protein PC113_g13465 [Phytophthora cactorum]KAG2920053.1 hypothetical protein PC117_g16624 [Phytophthora cactorum]KAG2925470.1 hypothetical protein PC115_g8229 [Phytophthora cactorum]
MRLREQANRLSEAFWRADGGTPDTPRQQVRTLSGIQAERRVLRAWIRASEAKKKRLDEDVELQSGRMSRVGTVATVSGTVILVPPSELIHDPGLDDQILGDERATRRPTQY